MVFPTSISVPLEFQGSSTKTDLVRVSLRAGSLLLTLESFHSLLLFRFSFSEGLARLVPFWWFSVGFNLSLQETDFQYNPKIDQRSTSHRWNSRVAGFPIPPCLMDPPHSPAVLDETVSLLCRPIFLQFTEGLSYDSNFVFFFSYSLAPLRVCRSSP